MQTVACITGMTHRQQVPVFRVEEKQQPITETYRSFPRFSTPCRTCDVNIWIVRGERPNQCRKYPVKDGGRELRGHTGLIRAPVFHGGIQDGCAAWTKTLERIPSEK